MALPLIGGRVCAQCGAKLKKDDRFCGSCGSSQIKESGLFGLDLGPKQKNCIYCGAVLEAKAKFCWSCGKPCDGAISLSFLDEKKEEPAPAAPELDFLKRADEFS
ncbi:MAG: zinc ribbon domain-containing protein, partial [Lachnospiraceae bacterium]|nr:zinc ribbon domain-containing protein [Lachnospiraceae bacterium]